MSEFSSPTSPGPFWKSGQQLVQAGPGRGLRGGPAFSIGALPGAIPLLAFPWGDWPHLASGLCCQLLSTLPEGSLLTDPKSGVLMPRRGLPS